MAGSKPEPALAEALRTAAPRIVSHMNEDHAMSLRAYLGYYGSLPDGDYEVWMTGLDAEGFKLEYHLRSGGFDDRRLDFGWSVGGRNA